MGSEMCIRDSVSHLGLKPIVLSSTDNKTIKTNAASTSLNLELMIKKYSKNPTLMVLVIWDLILLALAAISLFCVLSEQTTHDRKSKEERTCVCVP